MQMQVWGGHTEWPYSIDTGRRLGGLVLGVNIHQIDDAALPFA